MLLESDERKGSTINKKTLWLVTMAALCLVLYTIVSARMERSSSVIFGGAESGFANADINSANSRPTPTPEPTVDIWPQLTTKDFEDNVYLWIVNNDNLLSSAWEPEGGVSKIPGTRYMMYSTEYMQPLSDFLDAIKAAGFEDVFVNASYRTYSYQRQAYNSKASQIAYEMTGGKTVDYTDPIYQEAAEQAKQITALPGASEHQLGLAVDLLDKRREKLIYENMDPEFYAFLDEHCAEYGFIKRYPTRKLLLTGWDEPWHYRYVGVEVATFIMEQGICYEEFYAHYHPDFTY